MSSDRSFSFPLDQPFDYDVRAARHAPKPAPQDAGREDDAESFSSYLERNTREPERRETRAGKKPAGQTDETAQAHAAARHGEGKAAAREPAPARNAAPGENAEQAGALKHKRKQAAAQTVPTEAAATQKALPAEPGNAPAENAAKTKAGHAKAQQPAVTANAAQQSGQTLANAAGQQAKQTDRPAEARSAPQKAADMQQPERLTTQGPAAERALPMNTEPALRQPAAARAPMANDPRLQQRAAAPDGTARMQAGAAKTERPGAANIAPAQPQTTAQLTPAPGPAPQGLAPAGPLFGMGSGEAAAPLPQAGTDGTQGNPATSSVSDGQARLNQLSNMQTGNVPTAPRMTAQVGDALIQAARSGTDKLTLQLFPKELGTVDITLEMQNGRLKIIVAAERPETQQQLQQNQRDLERSLAEAGIEHGSADLSFADWADRGGRDPENPFERMTLSAAVTAEAVQDEPAQQTVSLTPGGIDLRL